MSTTINPPPVTESQRALLTRLVGQGREQTRGAVDQLFEQHSKDAA